MERKTLLQLGHNLNALKNKDFGKNEQERSAVILMLMGCCMQAFGKEQEGSEISQRAMAGGMEIFDLVLGQGEDVPPLSKADCEDIMADHFLVWDEMMEQPGMQDIHVYRDMTQWVELRIGKDRIDALRNADSPAPRGIEHKSGIRSEIPALQGPKKNYVRHNSGLSISKRKK